MWKPPLSTPGGCIVQRLESIPRAACLLCKLMHATRRLRYKSAIPMKQSPMFCASNGKHDFQDVLHKDSCGMKRGLSMFQYITQNCHCADYVTSARRTLPSEGVWSFCHLHDTQSWKCPLLLWRLLANVHRTSDCCDEVTISENLIMCL